MSNLEEIQEYAEKLELLYNKSDEATKSSTLNLLKNIFNEEPLVEKLENESFLLQQKNDIIDEYVFMTTSDKNGNIVDISQAYLDFTGYAREEVIGTNHSIFRNQEMDKKVIKNLWDTILKNKTWEGELKNHKSTGEEYWIYTIIKPLYDKNNIKIGYTSIKQDITTKKRLEEISTKDNLTLLHNRKQFDNYLTKELTQSSFKQEHIAVLLIGIDYYKEYKNKYGISKAHKLLLDVSNILRKKTNKNEHEMFKLSELEFSIIILNQDNSYVENFANILLKLVEALKIQNSESKLSEYLTISIGISNIDTKKHNISSNDLYNVSDSNLSKAIELGGNSIVSKISEKYLQKLKNIDNITKLSNRNVLVQELSILKDEAMLILLHINQLNSLKGLYGFEYIKKIIIDKAEELKLVLNHKEATLYSLNLNEFAILVTDKNIFDKYFLLLKHSILLSDRCQENNEIEDSCLFSDFTAGISYGIQNIFNHADLVLQEAIISKVSYKTYKINQSAKQLQEDTLNRLKIYKSALHSGKIIPYFQPILDTKSKKIVKYEALARIQTEGGDIVSPYYFLDSAKEDKTFEFFTRQMMQKVFNIFSKNSVEISMNLTYENINSETMVDYIKNRLDKYGGDGITFEILESEDILDYDIIENFISMARSYGCKISIDDFGSGYSNFTNIIKLDIDYIKLDGTLVEKLNVDENIRHMIKGLLMYARNANLKTIAEYVSSEEISITVEELGIDFIQGYYYGEPQPPEYYGLL